MAANTPPEAFLKRFRGKRRRMTLSRRLCPIVAACCLFGGGTMGSGAYGMPPDDIAPHGTLPPGIAPQAIASNEMANICEQAGIAAEQASGLPSGVLLAIGRVESGRWDNTRGRVAAWPWTINAAGKGQWYATKGTAAAAAQSLLDAGTRSIDVGCFQINLLWHPTAFASLEDAFDPDANARYAAAFLLSLFSRAGTWEAAIEAYHSADPVLGFAYRQSVYASWLTAAPVTSPVRVGLVPPRAPKPPAMPFVYAGVTVWTPRFADGAGEVVVMPGAPAAQTQGVASHVLPVVSYHMPRDLMPHR
jgi:Transglycosylase SLT domain